VKILISYSKEICGILFFPWIESEKKKEMLKKIILQKRSSISDDFDCYARK